MYGLRWSVLAAQMACWTCGGASAGAAAVPSGSSFATVPGTTMLVGAGLTGTGPGAATPPVGSCARAVLGRTSDSVVSSVRANARGAIKGFLFRRPAGLADGL